MDRGVGAAARLLPESDRKDLAIQALAGSETVSDLAARHGVSRKFVYQQTRKVHAALDGAFSSAKQDTEEVLFELAVTEAWLRPHESPHFHWLSYGRDSPTFRRTSVSRTDGCGLWSRRHVRSGVWARFVVSSAGCMGLTCIPSGSMRWQAPRSE